MAVDNQAVQLALRARLLTLSVCTTGSTTLEAIATGYQRASGSFLTDGFAPGMEVTPSGFTQTAVGVIDSVTALVMTINGGRTIQASGAGRSLSVGVPSKAAWDNVNLEPVAPQPYLEEEYVPATSQLRSMPAAGGSMEDTGLYMLRWYSKAGTGLQALRRASDAVLALFAAGTGLVVATGVTVRVRSDVAPVAGAIRATGSGWSVVVITVPWRLDYNHS